MLDLVVVPDESESITNTPVNASASITTVPRTTINMLFGVGELYSVA